MKDMSVEELLSEVRFGKDALEATEELLRRYEALEKENRGFWSWMKNRGAND